jgi:hypothetical protein
MSNSDLQAFLMAQLPACRLASARLVPSPDPSRLLVEVTCSAPADLALPCGYPQGTCPHKGPFLSDEDRAEETSLCQIRQALRLG